MKTFLYRLFGLGKLPVEYLAKFEKEGIVLYDEAIRGTVTYLDFRAPGRYSNWKRQWFSSSIILTKQRLHALRLRSAIIDVFFTDARFRQMQFSLEEPETLLVRFDASLFQADASGTIEYRFRTPHAPAFLDKLPELLSEINRLSSIKLMM